MKANRKAPPAKRPRAGATKPAPEVSEEARDAANAAEAAAAAAARARAIEDGTDEDQLEEAAEDADNDDLPFVDLPPGLVAGMTKADWDALPAIKLKWPRSCGVPPEGADVEIVDDDPVPAVEAGRAPAKRTRRSARKPAKATKARARRAGRHGKG
jgi:hypothetical protein